MKISPIKSLSKSNSIYLKNNANVHFLGNNSNDESNQRLQAFLQYDALLKQNEISRQNSKKNIALEDFEQSLALFEQGKYKEALEFFNSSFEVLNPLLQDSDKIYLKYYETGGDILQINGDLKGAEGLYQKALVRAKLKPEDKDEYQQILIKLGKNHLLASSPKAVDEISDSLINRNQKPDVIIKAMILKILNNDIEASDILGLINYMDTVQELYSLDENPDLAKILALFYNRIKEYELSSSVIEPLIAKSEKENKQNSQDYMDLAYISALNYQGIFEKNKKQTDFDKAAKYFETVLSTAKNLNNGSRYNESLLGLAELYFEDKDFAKAQKYLSTITNNSVPETMRKGFNLLGQIAFMQQDYQGAYNFFVSERKVMLGRDYDKEITVQNLKNLVRTSLKTKNHKAAEKYSNELNALDLNGQTQSADFEDLLQIGINSATNNNDNKKAQKLYEMALKAENATQKDKAVATIYLGMSQIADDNTLKGYKNMVEGAQLLESSVKDCDTEALMLLFQTYSSLGNAFYFKRSEYLKAAQYFEKALEISKKQGVLDKSSQKMKAKLYSRVAAAYHKAQDYKKSELYFSKYLKELTDNRFNYSSLNSEFIQEVADNYKTSEALKIATGLEMLGVSCVKTERFQTAVMCFQTALGIRRIVQGEKVDAARDLLAIGRALMVGNDFGLADSKQILQDGVDILKKELGEKHPEVQKEMAFLHDYYGINLTSLMKYAYKGIQSIVGKFDGTKNNWKKEIIDDFHLIYKDLNICE